MGASSFVTKAEGTASEAFRSAVDHARISNKWGPAGCLRISDGHWLFFGYASS